MIQRSGDDFLARAEADSGREAPVDGLDVERLMHELEDRLLGEIDRRGGRQAGWF